MDVGRVEGVRADVDTRYKLAWRLPLSAANDLFTLPIHCGGLGFKTPLEIMTQELGGHLQRCMGHYDVVRQITVKELGEAKDEKLCKSFLELQEEMKL